MNPNPDRTPVLDDAALAWAERGVWLACVAVYLTVFVGSLQAGVADLTALGRAIAFTLGTAVLGKVAVSLLSRASQPVETVPTADQDGTVGSLIDLTSSPNVSSPEIEAELA